MPKTIKLSGNMRIIPIHLPTSMPDQTDCIRALLHVIKTVERHGNPPNSIILHDYWRGVAETFLSPQGDPSEVD